MIYPIKGMEAAGIDVDELFSFVSGKWKTYIEAKAGYSMRDPRYIYYGNFTGTPLTDRSDFPKPIIPLSHKPESLSLKKSAKPGKYWEFLRANARMVRKKKRR
nr:hypothetical protein [Candidatus Sigynarchaeota archaeon]